jgi:serine/threonine protein kinase/GTPase SAR1 family protein
MAHCPNCGAEVKPGDNICSTCGQSITPVVLHDRYRILETVAQGGMGTIYKAEDIKLGNRHVAVKQLKMPSLKTREEVDKVTGLFEQEALLLANLNHVCLPDIYDYFSQDGGWYFVMKYIPGQTLSQFLHTIPDERLSIEAVLTIGITLCEVLEYLHTQTPSVIFGDLKPDNIMITPEGNLYLIDFGIARLFEVTQAENWKFVSQGYSPPEQYQNAQITPRADIYSLGATLHQLLSGQQPAKDKYAFAPLQLGDQSWAKNLEGFILSMVEPDEQQRPENVTLVKQWLQYIAGQQAQETSPWYGQTSGTQTPYGGYSSPYPSNVASSIDTYTLPDSVTFQNIRLSLGSIATLVWSPDGSRLAAANSEEVHIYAWLPEKNPLTEEGETLVPSYRLSANDLQTLSKSSDIEKQHPYTSADQYTPSDQYIPNNPDTSPDPYAPTTPADSYAPNNPNSPAAVYDPPQVPCIAWSPDGASIAVTRESTLYNFNISGEDSLVIIIPTNGENSISSVAWSPDGRFIATAYHDYNLVQVWEANSGEKTSDLQLNTGRLTALAWSPDGTYLALVNAGPTSYQTTPGGQPMSKTEIQIYEAKTGHEISSYNGHDLKVNDILWSPNGYIVSCSNDHTVKVWNPTTALTLRSLEANTESVECIAFLDKGRFLASVSQHGEIYIWNIDTWAQVESFNAFFRVTIYRLAASNIAFHPINSLLAISNYSDVISLYEIDAGQLYLDPSQRSGVQYTNAKVVLLGDRGVGKSGLGLVLSQQAFTPTESTHGRVVWTFAKKDNKMPDGRKETRETLLWDLAGQPGYRLIHQLHLSEVAVALVVFDAYSETDPFAGIFHWVRALRTAQSVRGKGSVMKMLLVLARIDRGGKRVSQGRIDELAQKLGFDGYFETSAKEGTNIAALAEAIEKAIDWDQLPKVTSTELFQRIKSFLVAEKQVGRLLSTANDLYRAFMGKWHPGDNTKDFSAEFATGIELLKSTGLIRRLSFGNLVLLQPELLDSYASALINAVRDEPDGLGSIAEEAVHAANFAIPTSERISDPEQEKLLLIAMVKDLLSYEIALREQGEGGPYLIFPSESTRENPDLPDPENVSMVFTFEGPILNIYATLAVRLSHSGLFIKRELWKNAVIYDAEGVGGTCGIWLKEIEDGKGELTLFFDAHASEETRFHFEEYVRAHLQKKALPESVQSRRVFKCTCGFVASDQLVRMRTARGFNWFRCSVCETRVDMRDHIERIRSTSPSRVPEMDRSADRESVRAAAQSKVQGKQETNDFDVFLCYNPADQVAIIDIGKRLKEQGILPWLDKWELQPGRSWQRSLEQQIGQIKSAAVFVGKEGIGPWQQQELEVFLREFVKRDCPVIPVILSDAPQKPELPLFLESIRWVDFHEQAPAQDLDPMGLLIWGIRGERQPSR